MFFKVGCALESAGGLVKREVLGSTKILSFPVILTQKVCGRAWDFSFLSSSKMMPIFLVHGPFLEYIWTSWFWGFHFLLPPHFRTTPWHDWVTGMHIVAHETFLLPSLTGWQYLYRYFPTLSLSVSGPAPGFDW